MWIIPGSDSLRCRHKTVIPWCCLTPYNVHGWQLQIWKWDQVGRTYTPRSSLKWKITWTALSLWKSTLWPQSVILLHLEIEQKQKKKGTQDNACLFPYFKDSSMIMRPNSHGLSSQLFNVAREKWGSLVKSTCYVTRVISFARFPCFSRVTLKSWEECGYEATTELPYKLLCNSYEHHIYSAILLTASWLYTLKIHPSPRCLLGPEHSTCGNDFFFGTHETYTIS